jgi:hypothetical protein
MINIDFCPCPCYNATKVIKSQQWLNLQSAAYISELEEGFQPEIYSKKLRKL